MDVKELGKRITQEENKLEQVSKELETKLATKNAIEAEITKKTTDFEVYMSQRDAENKRMRTEINAQRDDLNKQKEEFQEILRGQVQEKTRFSEEKKMFEIQKLRHEASTRGVQEFILAVRRAVNLLGI